MRISPRPPRSPLPALALLGLLFLLLLPTTSAQDFESESLAPGEFYPYTFEEAGEVTYHCHPHPWMEGDITVLASDGEEPRTHEVRIMEPGSDQDTWRFEPAELEIHAGDTVRWVNAGRATHDVMGWIGSAPPADHHDHDHGHTEESPALAPWLAVAAVLGLVLATRRRP